MRRGKIFGKSHADNHDIFNNSYNHVVLSAARERDSHRVKCDNGNSVSIRGGRIMSEKTGYYDRNGKPIRDGDKIWTIFNGDIMRGYVEEIGGEWRLVTKDFELALRHLDDIEILEEDD